MKNTKWSNRPFRPAPSDGGHDVFTAPVENCVFCFDTFSTTSAVKATKAAKDRQAALGNHYLPADAAKAADSMWTNLARVA